ncbi:AAA family ATPase [Gordonia aichiensis]|uniref:AAA family ATPase n=1 Tax=Gordonia aichiensis TaxID=36820 RepID=UPI0032637574
MTTNRPLRPIVGVITADDSPRLLYRTDAGAWIVANHDPFMRAFGDAAVAAILRAEYASERDALRALVAAGDYFDRTSPDEVEAADRALRSTTVNLYRLPVDGDEISDASLQELLSAVAATIGEPMRAERAAAELSAPPAGAPTVVCAAHGHVDRPRFDPIDLPGGGQYWPRALFDTSDVAFLRELRAGGSMHARLSGPPGSGKTTLVDAAFGDDIICVQGHPDLTVASLYGQYLPGEPGSGAAWRWVDGPAVRAAREGKVLLIDEANRAPRDVDDALLSLTDKRRQIINADRPDLPPVRAVDGFMVIVSYNHSDIGIRPLSASLLRRLSMHVRVDTDYAVAARLGVGDDLLQVAENLRTSGRRYGINHHCDPAWYPQLADLEGAEAMRRHGPQAMFGPLTASATEPARVRDAAQVFASVFGAIVTEIAELGSSH